ncbi:MAG: hypothetical protein RL497_2751 [Pseudomonadota bacterium]
MPSALNLQHNYTFKHFIFFNIGNFFNPNRARICGFILSSVYLFCLPETAQAAETPAAPAYEFSNSRLHPVQSPQGLKHQLIVTLPDSYATDPNKRYPVVYYLDAYWDFPLLYATHGNLRYDRAIPECILVGLSVAADTDINAYRTGYFSIAHKPQNKHQLGQANVLYAHLSQDIIPYIDTHFRTVATPSGRVLAGQSMGGLFALYGLYQKPSVFQRFIAINPAVAGSELALNKLDNEQLAETKKLDARVFISHGSEEYAPFRDPIIQFKKQLKKRRYAGLYVQNMTLEGMGHTGGKGEAYGKGLLWVLQDLTPKEKSGLQADMGG